MPVTISLKDIVQIDDKKLEQFWPSEFHALCKRIQTDHPDKTGLGALADWLDEHGEPKLAKGCRVLARIDVVVQLSGSHHWQVTKMPSVCGYYVSSWHSLIHCAAQIADNIQKAYDEIDGVLKPVEPLPEPDENRPDEGPIDMPLDILKEGLASG